MHQDILRAMLTTQQYYIVVESKFTKHHIEKLMGSCKDRGRWKWIAETNMEAFDTKVDKEEAQRSHIDGGDLFPRVFFKDESLITELFAWFAARDLQVTDITTPKY